MNKLSIIIPTLQINLDMLIKLITILDKDYSVDEILIIDNSGKDFDDNFYSLSSKIKTIINKENEYVNPCWNKGVKTAKNEYFALFNDDVIIQDNFCSDVLKLFQNNTGLIGISQESIINIKPSKYKNIKFNNKKPKIIPAKTLNSYFGIIMFGRKSSYFPIPDDMKIWCGDDYLFYMNRQNSKENYKLTKCKIYHAHSLTSSLPLFNKIKQKDLEIMKPYFLNWNVEHFSVRPKCNSFFQNIFSIRNNFEKNHKIITVLGIKIKIKSKKKVNI